MAFIPFLIIGCDSAGGVTLSDTKGNKYTFKNESVTCSATSWGEVYCEGSAIKKNIAGNRYAIDFGKEMCLVETKRGIETYDEDSLLCNAAIELGKF